MLYTPPDAGAGLRCDAARCLKDYCCLRKGLTKKFPAAQLTRMSRPPSLAQVSSTHRLQSPFFLTSP